MITKICPICRTRFKTYPSRVKNGRGIYCSPSCKKLGGRKADNPNWRGGETKIRGYVYVHAPNHPFANQNGYVKKSRLLVEQSLPDSDPHLIEHLGKYYLRPECRITFVDGNKENHSITNLKIL